MKLINLKIENIASIETAEIDFDRGPLADTSVFLITGDTGAGKSTILDSICLALYNTTPRLNGASGTKSNFGTDNITARNTSNLLRHGARQASAVLTFRGTDGVEYVAAWQVKRNRNYKLTSPELTLTWGDTTVRNADAIRKITDEAVGLDFDQFCRTTMLAQGQFTQFLKSKDDEKSEILEKLTGTGIYSEIGKKIEVIKKEKEAEYNAQKNLTAGIVLMSREETESLKENMAKAAERKKLLDAEAARLDLCIRWMENRTRLQTAVTAAQQAHNVAVEVINSDSFREEGRIISDMDRTEGVRNSVQRMKDAERKTAELEREAERLKGQYMDLLKGRNGLREWIGRKNEYLNSLKEKLDAAAASASMYANVQKIETLLRSASAASVRIRENNAAVSKLGSRLPELEKGFSDAEDVLGKAVKAVEQKDKEYEKTDADLKALKPDEVNVEADRLNREKDGVNALKGHIAELKNCSSTLERLTVELKAIDEECSMRMAELAKAKEKNEEAVARYNNARMAFESVELSLKEWTVSIRSKLKEGDVCPVCGQVIETLVTDEECSERLKPLENELVRQEKELRDTDTLCRSLDMIVERLKKERAEKTSRKDAAEADVKKTAAVVIEGCKRLSVAGVDVEDGMDVSAVERAVEERTAGISAAMETLLGIQKKINAGNRLLSDISRELSSLRKGVDKAVKDRDNAKENRMNAMKEMERLSSLADVDGKAMEKSLVDAGSMITIDGWREAWNVDPEALTDRIVKAAAEYQEWEKAVAQTEKLLSQAVPALGNVEKILTTVSERWKSWTEIEVTEAVPTEGLADKCFSFAERVQTLTASLAAERDAKDKAQADIDVFLASNVDINLQRVELLCGIRNLKEIREAHDRKIADEKSAAVVLAGRKKECDVHVSARPESLVDEDTEETLRTSLDETRAAVEEVVSEMGRIDQKLKTDEQNAARFNAEKEKEEALRQVFAEWDTLNKLFGGGDGKTFRRIAQSFILNDLLYRANGYLTKLNKRYKLDCEPGTLTIRMMDMYQNDAQGPVDILSGGEGFLVSLSLALALSSLNRRNLSVDTLFIDEGFGTLSSDVLNTVMNMLEKLQSLNGKRVGIISHVEGLKERIAVQIKVKRIDQTRSMVEVTDSSGRISAM